MVSCLLVALWALHMELSSATRAQVGALLSQSLTCLPEAGTCQVHPTKKGLYRTTGRCLQLAGFYPLLLRLSGRRGQLC